jgi:transposase-like protein
MTEERSRTSREEWAKRVERWSDSGQTAKEFASATGLNERTLIYWKWRLGREARGLTSTSAKPRRPRAETPALAVEAQEATTAFVQITTTASAHFEIALANERRLRVPSNFDDVALRRLLAVLEGAR